MIKEFVEAWDQYKNDLENYFRTHIQREYSEYIDIVKALFEQVINKYYAFNWQKFDLEDIVLIDDGNYQGTQIFILHRPCYQPEISDYVYTSTYYGSCSGCDTLQAIQWHDEDLPSEDQIKEYMTLALHLLQKCHFMKEED